MQIKPGQETYDKNIRSLKSIRSRGFIQSSLLKEFTPNQSQIEGQNQVPPQKMFPFRKIWLKPLVLL